MTNTKTGAIRNTLLTICLTILACQYVGYKLLTSGTIQASTPTTQVSQGITEQDQLAMIDLVTSLESQEVTLTR